MIPQYKLATVPTTKRLSLSADDWELFTGSMNCTKAAAGLNRAANLALKCGDPREAISILAAEQERWREYGANDSEPCIVVADIIAAKYGQEWWDKARYGGL